MYWIYLPSGQAINLALVRRMRVGPYDPPSIILEFEGTEFGVMELEGDDAAKFIDKIAAIGRGSQDQRAAIGMGLYEFVTQKKGER